MVTDGQMVVTDVLDGDGDGHDDMLTDVLTALLHC